MKLKKDVENLMIIEITNSKVQSFFERNSTLDPNIVLANIIDFYEYVSNNLSNGNNQQLLSYVIESTNKIDNLKEQINSIKEQNLNIKEQNNHIKEELFNSISLKLYDVKNSYIEDVKNLLSLDENKNIDKISNILNINNQKLLNDTKELIKKEEEIDVDLFNQFSEKITTETKNLLIESVNNNSWKDSFENFVNNINSKFSDFSSNFQQNANSSEERVSLLLNQVKSLSSENENHSKILCNQFETFMNKFQNSSLKGKFSENLLFDILTNSFPSSEIIDSSKTPNSCDFQLKRQDKPLILIENKDYKRNVNTEEVDKFLRDLDFNNCSGIILSQQSGICNKKNWLIEIRKSNVIVYVHNVNYDSSKIQIAVDIIDHLNFALSLPSNNEDNENFSISNELLTQINIEFSSFICQKDAIIQLSKNFQRDLLSKIKKFELPSLESFLTSKSFDSIFKCKQCSFSSNKKNALNAHMSKHKLDENPSE